MEDDGVAFAFIQNAMTKKRFEQVKRFLHFVNNRTLLPKGHPRWNPLQKIKPVIDGMLERFRFCYTIGQYMSIDESMIKYKGKQIRFIQYMPAKPIKHGIKVFVLACAETGYCYGFWVYCGKENDDCSPVEIVARLFEQDSGESLIDTRSSLLCSLHSHPISVRLSQQISRACHLHGQLLHISIDD